MVYKLRGHNSGRIHKMSIITSLKQHIIDEKRNLITAYGLVPIGLVLMLMVLYGVEQVIIKTGINFPSSVCTMLLLYFALIGSTFVLGKSRTNKFVDNWLQVPCGWALRWMNIFFTPAFITLPLSDWISAKEALTIAAVFLIGYIVTTAIIGWFTVALQKLLGWRKFRHAIEREDNGTEMVLLSTGREGSTTPGPSSLPHHTTSLPEPSSAMFKGADHEVTSSKDRLICSRVSTIQVVDSYWSDFWKKHFDDVFYLILFIVSIPIYFATGYGMPIQLTTAVLCFFIVLKTPPPRYKKFFHPVLCSVVLSWGAFFIYTLIKYQRPKAFLTETLREYKTGKNYLLLFNHTTVKPGAGDIFSSLLDIGIVALALPMYQYRLDLKRHFLSLVPPILLMSAGCLFIYPILCYHIGISAQRSLGFVGRSVTLALGTPVVLSLHGSIPLMAVTTVISGVIGALTGDWFFKKLRIREDDYVTRGLTLGVNCGAIATAHLLTVDPRAAAISSLSFVLFGTIMVILTAINPVADLLRRMVGL